MKKEIAAERVSLVVRVPLECKPFLEKKLADYHCSSISGVVVTILRDAERREGRAQAAHCGQLDLFGGDYSGPQSKETSS
jgi:hypothetical protein